MAPVNCPTCSRPVMPGDLICQSCGANLVRHSMSAPSAPPSPPAEEPPPAASAPDDGPSTVAWTPFCPHCGADVPDVGNVTCVECLRPLRTGTAAQPSALRVTFSSGEVECAVGEEVPLGRDRSQCRVADVFRQFDNVSRKHATIGLDPSGQAWVRDEGSTNGTYVNNRRVEPGQQATLSDGDELRLAADVAGRVKLG